MAHYVYEGVRWGSATLGVPGGNITWAVDSSVPADFVPQITAAFAEWSRYGNISFTRVASTATSSIDIQLGGIDGPNNTLGQASYSFSAGVIGSAAVTFDSAENWHAAGGDVVSGPGARLYLIALHEIGHALGLGHYEGGPAVMNSILTPAITGLTPSDIHGIQEIYGAAGPTNAFGVFVYSPQSSGGTIFALYDGIFGRAPDPLGLERFADHINTGATARDIARLLIETPEGRSHLGGQSNDDFLLKLYDTTLHRAPDSGGFAHWKGALDAGMSRAEVAASLALSPENLAGLQSSFDAGVFVPDKQAAEVARLYYGVLDRAPDEGGLRVFVGALDHGASLSGIAQALIASDEYETRSTGDTDSQYIDAMYQQLLNRPADTGGQQHWLEALGRGESRSVVANGLLDSVEFQSKFAGASDDGYLDVLYQSVLGRTADAGGKQGWLTALSNQAMSRTDVAHGLVAAAEFQTQHVGPSDGQFVEGIYDGALGRQSDPGGFQHWVDMLARGTSRADVAVALSQGSEAEQHLLSAIELGWHLA